MTTHEAAVATLRDPLSILRNAEIAPRLVEDAKPLGESLDWRLSELYWNTSGTRGFIESYIPYTITSQLGLYPRTLPGYLMPAAVSIQRLLQKRHLEKTC